jgi:hypothetical protein
VDAAHAPPETTRDDLRTPDDPQDAPQDAPPTRLAEGYLLMAFVDADGQAHLAWSTDGGENFAQSATLPLPSGVTCYAPPALASRSGTVFVAYTALDGGTLEFAVRSKADGSEWSEATVLLSAMSSSTAATSPSFGLVAAGDFLYAAYPNVTQNNVPVLLKSKDGTFIDPATGHADTANQAKDASLAYANNEDKQVAQDEGGLGLAYCKGSDGFLYCLFPATGSEMGSSKDSSEMSWSRAWIDPSTGEPAFDSILQPVVNDDKNPKKRAVGRPGTAVTKDGKLYAAYCTNPNKKNGKYGFALFCLENPTAAPSKLGPWKDLTPTTIQDKPKAPALATNGTTLFLAYKDANSGLAMYRSDNPATKTTWSKVTITTPPVGSMLYDPALIWVDAAP